MIISNTCFINGPEKFTWMFISWDHGLVGQGTVDSVRLLVALVLSIDIHTLHPLTISSISVSNFGHLMTVIANSFIFNMPGCPICKYAGVIDVLMEEPVLRHPIRYNMQSRRVLFKKTNNIMVLALLSHNVLSNHD